ncbi:hypothetical protein [Streptomyces sp. NPDC047315]|uniref:hypothetical protein n=1 Tax=Streptomyces sp. NPDC047315 TaxID=3155142 RepID=UPI0034075049
MARVYATATDYQSYTGQTPPEDIASRLARASVFLDSRVFRLCWYDADPTTGLPTHPLVVAAFRDALCAQVEWGEEVGDTTGAAGVGWGNVEIGSVRLGRSLTATSAEDSPGRQIAPAVWDHLRAPDLTPDVLLLGLVVS